MACVIAVDSYAQALATVNDTRFDLTAGIVTRDLARQPPCMGPGAAQQK
jgi:acyl-CoA reductase-like NAD-dependent aldehyde dehydrogenase